MNRKSDHIVTILIILACLAFFFWAYNTAAARADTQLPRHGTAAYRAHVICVVFGPRHCRAAVSVARCESGLRPWAHNPNGDYRGMFQMGPRERRIYGHGNGAWVQAIAAHRYFLRAGWAPWGCKPA